MSYRLLNLEQIVQLHVLAIARYGGSEGVRDIGRLESAVACQNQEIFGNELYKTIYEKSAALIRNIIGDHPFSDGNKRTAMLAGVTLLEINGLEVTFKKKELEDFAVHVAVEHLEVVEIAEWLKCHTARA